VGYLLLRRALKPVEGVMEGVFSFFASASEGEIQRREKDKEKEREKGLRLEL